MRRSCSAHHVLFKHYTAKIISARVQTQLRSCFSYCEPARLDIFDVGKHDSAECDHSDIFIRRNLISHALEPVQQRAVILKRPRNKREKTFGSFWFFVLHFPEPHKVLKPLIYSFNMSEHHRGTGG